VCEGITAVHLAALVDLLKHKGVARVYDSRDGKAATYSYYLEKTLIIDVWNGMQKLYKGELSNCPYPAPKQIGLAIQAELFQIHTTHEITHNCP